MSRSVVDFGLIGRVGGIPVKEVLGDTDDGVAVRA